MDKNLLEITDYKVLGKLPNPFLFDNGQEVKTKEDWQLRRKEIYKTAVELQYGKQPPKPEFLEVEFLSEHLAGFCQVKITTGPKSHPVSFILWLILPEGFNETKDKLPFVIDGDLCWRYWFNKDIIKTFTDKNIAIALFNRTQIVPDRKLSERKGQLYEAYPDYDFGAIAAWAWGYSRCVDALEKLGIINENSITFTGHSRGGKTSALAGALDERATIVNPNETCAGSCGCYRVHMSAIAEDKSQGRSEQLSDLLRAFDFWMGKDMKPFADREEELPFDTHYLKSLIAPRVFFNSQAASDIWSNPIGSWQTDMAAKEVYDFLGVPQNYYWYFRKGFHEHTLQDMEMLANIILHELKNEPLKEGFFETPFEEPELIFDWKAPNK